MRLSGWARLWIVLLVPIVGLVVWARVSNEQWQGRRDCGGPCDFRPVIVSEDQLREVRSLYPQYNDIGDAELKDGLRRAKERHNAKVGVHRDRLARAVWEPLVGGLIAFAVAMIAKSAAIWVWRGFRSSPPPAAP